MWIYWALFLWPALAAFVYVETQSSGLRRTWAPRLYGTFLAMVIGLRFEVGVDWGNYLQDLDTIVDKTFVEVLQGTEPGYYTLAWITARSDIGIWLVNLACAVAFASGLVAFCQRLPNPWLALTIAAPYMSIVMAMNYTRQGAAFGFVLWALISLHDERVRRFVVFIVLASLFHKSAAILMPLGALVTVRNRWWVASWIGIASLGAYWLFVAPTQENLVETYLADRMASDGALVRVLMSAAAAGAFLLRKNRFDMAPLERRFCTWLAIITLLFLPALWISPSSTAVDRIALYFMPVQLIGFSHVASSRVSGFRLINVSAVAVTYGVVQYVWFNYSNFYFAWLPYRFYPLEIP